MQTAHILIWWLVRVTIERVSWCEIRADWFTVVGYYLVNPFTLKKWLDKRRVWVLWSINLRKHGCTGWRSVNSVEKRQNCRDTNKPGGISFFFRNKMYVEFFFVVVIGLLFCVIPGNARGEIPNRRSICFPVCVDTFWKSPISGKIIGSRSLGSCNVQTAFAVFPWAVLCTCDTWRRSSQAREVLMSFGCDVATRCWVRSTRLFGVFYLETGQD